jgi:methionine--tRNA ligase beta chain
MSDPTPTSAPVPTTPVSPVSAEPATIQYDDFAKVQLRVATVIAAEAVEKSKKLLKLQVDLGNEQRQILAGIKEHYTPEEMVGKQIIVVANLAPREVIKGQVSNGMLLAASDPATGKVIVLSPSAPVAAGAGVK